MKQECLYVFLPVWRKTGINVDFSMLHGQVPQLNKAEDCTWLVHKGTLKVQCTSLDCPIDRHPPPPLPMSNLHKYLAKICNHIIQLCYKSILCCTVKASIYLWVAVLLECEFTGPILKHECRLTILFTKKKFTHAFCKLCYLYMQNMTLYSITYMGWFPKGLAWWMRCTESLRFIHGNL
jgi:hypothetical protein